MNSQKQKVHVSYTNGPKMQPTHAITKSELMIICKEIRKALKQHYIDSSKDYQISKVQPESISEGGIELIYKGNNTDKNGYNRYKSFRLGLNHPHRYPWVHDLDEWKTNDVDIVLPTCSKKESLGSYLKAFHDAPLWSMEELIIFKTIFDNHGILFTKMPKNKSLSSYEYMCN